MFGVIRRWLIVLAPVVACACGDDETGAGGAGSTGISDASSSEVATGVTSGDGPCELAGSCDRVDGSACAEYGGGVNVPAAETACENGQGTWSDGACDTSGAIGGCRVEGNGACLTNWYWPPEVAENVEQACADQTGTFVVP